MSNPVCLANGCSHRGASLERHQGKWRCRGESCPVDDGARPARKRKARTPVAVDTDSDTTEPSDLDDIPDRQPKQRKATPLENYNRARQDLSESMKGSQWYTKDGALMPPGDWHTNLCVFDPATGVGFAPKLVGQNGNGDVTFEQMAPLVPLGTLEEMQTSLEQAAETLEEMRRVANEECRMARLRKYMEGEEDPTTSGVEECIRYTPYGLCELVANAAKQFKKAATLEKLLEEIRASMQCPICHDTRQTAAVQTPCCHQAICRDCLRRSLDSHRDLVGCPTCPLCRHSHDENPEVIAATAIPCRPVDDVRTLLAKYDDSE